MDFESIQLYSLPLGSTLNSDFLEKSSSQAQMFEKFTVFM